VAPGSVGIDWELDASSTLLTDSAWRELSFLPAERIWAEDRPERWLMLWTAKEAVLKGEGVGFGKDLRSLRILPGAEAGFLKARVAGRSDRVIRSWANTRFALAIALT